MNFSIDDGELQRITTPIILVDGLGCLYSLEKLIPIAQVVVDGNEEETA